MMASLLYLGAGSGLAVVHLTRATLRLPATEAPLRRSDLPWLALVILAGGLGGPLLLMFGLARSDAASASLLWFCAIGFGAQRLAPLFRRRAVWRCVDLLTGCMMLIIAAGLIRGG